MVDCEFEIAKMEGGHDELTCLSNMSLGEADGFEGDFELLKPVCVIISSDTGWAGTSTALAELSVLAVAASRPMGIHLTVPLCQVAACIGLTGCCAASWAVLESR